MSQSTHSDFPALASELGVLIRVQGVDAVAPALKAPSRSDPLRVPIRSAIRRSAIRRSGSAIRRSGHPAIRRSAIRRCDPDPAIRDPAIRSAS